MKSWKFLNIFNNPATGRKIAKKPRIKRSMLSRISLRGMIRVCPGRRHAWFESSVGPVRKPLAVAS